MSRRRSCLDAATVGPLECLRSFPPPTHTVVLSQLGERGDGRMYGLSIADIAILVGYFVIVAAIGVVSARFVRNREDFVMGGRRFGKTLMIFFTFGAGTHADSAIGVASKCYQFGLAGIWYQWAMLFTVP